MTIDEFRLFLLTICLAPLLLTKYSMIPTHLIQAALQLTGKIIGDMNEIVHWWDYGHIDEFSIEKFCYYLLSPEFIEKYLILHNESWPIWNDSISRRIWVAITESQRKDEKFPDWNHENLISLLEKIWTK